MDFALVQSRATVGIDTVPVSIEVHLSRGLPNLKIVGLPDMAVRESRERIRSALLNSHFDFPAFRITVNLAPADLPKDGGHFDLPMALGILAASGQVNLGTLDEYEFAGELALSGDLREIKHGLAIAKGCMDAGRSLCIPSENSFEASFIKSLQIYPASTLREVVAHLNGFKRIQPYQRCEKDIVRASYPDLADVHGQAQAKRALEVAAAGGHHLVMMGPPGTGKTMLALRLPGLLPELNEAEALSSGLIYSLAKKTIHWGQRPFRSPHHTLSNVALVGGGNPPMPGEISLSHQGILFLDELPEFKRSSLEALREPLESASIHIARASHSVEYPANFQLVSAMNPCPCGYLTHPTRACICSEQDIRRYHKRLSGPIMDRIDLQITVDALEYRPGHIADGEPSEAVMQRVAKARALQARRAGRLNARIDDKTLSTLINLSESANALVDRIVTKSELSNRALCRLMRVARTVADLAGSAIIEREHLLEAICYRVDASD